jgi:hypothetical protein
VNILPVPRGAVKRDRILFSADGNNFIGRGGQNPVAKHLAILLLPFTSEITLRSRCIVTAGRSNYQAGEQKRWERRIHVEA